MIHKIKQKLPEKIDGLGHVSQEDIINENTYRRASADFVSEFGGRLGKLFLEKTVAMGIINERSRFMCQRSPIVKGAYPSPPNWHIDRMPGSKFNLIEHLTQPVSGAIVSICSEEIVETTEFISEGYILLDEPVNTNKVHKPGQYLEDDEGEMNWTTEQIENQLRSGLLSKERIEPNAIYSYDSTFFHKCPQFSHKGGYRIIMRVNTPPADFPYSIPTDNRILGDNEVYFTLNEENNRWKKYQFMHGIVDTDLE